MADYKRAKRRLLVLGYNATLTTAVEAPRQPHHHFDQIQVTLLSMECAGMLQTLCPSLPVCWGCALSCRILLSSHAITGRHGT